MRRWLTAAFLASAVAAGVAAVPATAFAGGGETVPFTDPNQVGSLTLCNTHEQPITSGSLLSVPFVWRAVSSARVPSGYTRATLYLFQPIEYVQPADWTGYQLTDDSLFSNAAHPMAQATYADAPLIWPNNSIPPHWNGLYQLRMVFTSPDKQPWTTSYPAAVVKVSGKSWTLVQGGGSSCTAGRAESLESLVLPQSKTSDPQGPESVVPYADRNKKSSPSNSKGTSKSGSQAAGGTSTTTSGAGADASSTRSASGPIPGTSGKGGGSAGGVVAGGVSAAVVILAAGAALLVFRRRRRVAPTSTTDL